MLTFRAAMVPLIRRLTLVPAVNRQFILVEGAGAVGLGPGKPGAGQCMWAAACISDPTRLFLLQGHNYIHLGALAAVMHPCKMYTDLNKITSNKTILEGGRPDEDLNKVETCHYRAP